MRKIFLFCFLIPGLVLQVGCETPSTDREESGSPQNQPGSFFNDFDPSDTSMFGKVNPAAPKQTEQFDFMVGTFVCQDSLLVNGAWKVSNAIWEARYTLNGFAVEDVYRNDNYAGMSIRFFNTRKQKWDVYFFGMPGEHTGLWEGTHTEGKMVMKQKRKGPNGENLESRLTFYNITEQGFDWMGELRNLDNNSTTINWKIKAKRR